MKIKDILDEISYDKALKIITSHPTKKKLYQSLDAEHKDKLVKFFMKDPNCNYFKWDKSKNNFVATGQQGIRGESKKCQNLKEQ